MRTVKSLTTPMARRNALRLGLCGVVSTLAACGGRAAPAPPRAIPTQQLGVITGNDAKLMAEWQRWLGRAEDHDLLYFNQESWQKLTGSIDFIIDLGGKAVSDGRFVQWSVPVGGKGVYAEVAAGKQDALYTRIAQAILAVYPDTGDRICVRLPWEFNMESQTLAARDAAGRWNARRLHRRLSPHRRACSAAPRRSSTSTGAPISDWAGSIPRPAIQGTTSSMSSASTFIIAPNMTIRGMTMPASASSTIARRSRSGSIG
jgi:hypothetical protein